MSCVRIAVLLFFLPALLVRADVKTEEKTHLKFEGAIGRIAGWFGGKAAREGLVDTVAVKGNRKITFNDQTGQIIDLDEEKVYDLDMRRKAYRVTTFAEMRRRMEEAREKAARAMEEQAPEQKAEAGEVQWEVDFSVKESGQRKNVSGYDCREVVSTITVREKGKTLEESGRIVMSVNMWLAPEIKAVREIAEFDMRYFEKLEGSFSFAGSAEQMAMAVAMYPGLKEAMGRFEAENVNMEGTPVLTVMQVEGVRSPEQAAEAKPQRDEPVDVTSVRGLGGLVGRRIGRRKAESDTPEASKDRATIFTTTHELLKVDTAVAASDVAIPEGFKERR